MLIQKQSEIFGELNLPLIRVFQVITLCCRIHANKLSTIEKKVPLGRKKNPAKA
jgi:hypothetical protein